MGAAFQGHEKRRGGAGPASTAAQTTQRDQARPRRNRAAPALSTSSATGRAYRVEFIFSISGARRRRKITRPCCGTCERNSDSWLARLTRRSPRTVCARRAHLRGCLGLIPGPRQRPPAEPGFGEQLDACASPRSISAHPHARLRPAACVSRPVPAKRPLARETRRGAIARCYARSLTVRSSRCSAIGFARSSSAPMRRLYRRLECVPDIITTGMPSWPLAAHP